MVVRNRQSDRGGLAAGSPFDTQATFVEILRSLNEGVAVDQQGFVGPSHVESHRRGEGDVIPGDVVGGRVAATHVHRGAVDVHGAAQPCESEVRCAVTDFDEPERDGGTVRWPYGHIGAFDDGIERRIRVCAGQQADRVPASSITDGCLSAAADCRRTRGHSLAAAPAGAASVSVSVDAASCQNGSHGEDREGASRQPRPHRLRVLVVAELNRAAAAAVSVAARFDRPLALPDSLGR